MPDVIFVTITIAFFGVAWLLMKGCERILGPDLELVAGDAERDDDALEQAA